MNPINTRTVFSAQAVVKNTTETSAAIDLNQAEVRQAGVAGSFSLQVALTGDGTATLKYQVSNDGVNFLTPTGAADIKAGLTKTGGPGSDGKDIYSFTPVLGKFIRFTVTETGNAAAIAVTAVLAYQ